MSATRPATEFSIGIMASAAWPSRAAAAVLERREGLEQLRALEHGMRIDAALVDTVPLGVDTPADLERARAMLAPGE